MPHPHKTATVPAFQPKHTDQSEAEFKSAVEEFERSLVRPLISGELIDWIDDVQQAWSELAAQLHVRVTVTNSAIYREIGDQDPELLPKIDALKSEDEAIENASHHIDQLVQRAAEHVPKLEPDEEKAKRHLRPLIDEGSAFVLRLRKQSVAVQTWYVEAFNRDRGAVD